MAPIHTPRGTREWLVTLALLAAVVLAYVGWRAHGAERPYAYLVGDCVFYAAIGESLLADGDLLVMNQLAREPASAAALLATGQLALDRHGRVVPKHPVLMPIVSLPFQALAGPAGLLAFNVVVTVALAAGIGVLGGGGPGGRLVAALALLATPFLNYAWNYSPDLFATALVVWGLAAMRRDAPATGGVLVALATWAKLTNVVALALAVAAGALTSRRALLRALAGAGAVLAVMGAFNHAVYGAPWTTGYHRSLTVAGGEVALYTHTGLFTVPFLEGLADQLFDPRQGLIRNAPVWFAWPIGLAVALRAGEVAPGAGPRWLWPAVLAAGALGNLALLAPYAPWRESHHANRFLFVSIALALALLVPAASALIHAVRDRIHPRPPPAG